jgi:hypothetical protein
MSYSGAYWSGKFPNSTAGWQTIYFKSSRGFNRDAGEAGDSVGEEIEMTPPRDTFFTAESLHDD